jgi:hypothetical protein
MADDGTDTRDPGPEDADPLLVRPFLDPDRGDPATPAPTWPAPADDPDAAPDDAGVPAAPATAPPPPRPGRTRRRLLLAGAAAVTVIALGAAGVSAMLPGDDGDPLPIPTAALPPLPTSAAPPPSTPAGAEPTGTAPARTIPNRTRTTEAGSAPATTRPPARAATTTTAAPPARVSPDPTAPMLAPPAVARVGRIAAGGGLCLDLNGGVPFDGNHVQVYDCNTSVAQVWTLTPDGTLQVVGKCANLAGDGSVHIVSCDGRTTAQWRAGPDRTLVNAANDKCLTDPSGGTRSGAAVRVTACSGAGNQEWSVP